MEFLIIPKRVLTFMLSIISLLVVLHVTQLAIYYYVGDPDIFDFVELIDFDYEANLPSFYSSSALLFTSLLLWIIGWYKFKQKALFKYHWLGLAFVFTFLGVDEGIALHEDIGDIFENKEWVDAQGFLFFAWVVPYGVLLLFFALSYLRFVLALPGKIKVLFICAGVMFVGGAMGLEIFSAREADLHGTDTVLYSALYTMEEILEMTSIALFCYALLLYIQQFSAKVVFHIDR